MRRKKAFGCVVRGTAIRGVQQYACGCGSTYALPNVFFLPLGQKVGCSNGLGVLLWASVYRWYTIGETCEGRFFLPLGRKVGRRSGLGVHLWSSVYRWFTIGVAVRVAFFYPRVGARDQ